jgi:predicted transcriptional regulator
MDTKVLTQIGLTENESKVYLALLELGKANIGKIAEKSRVHRTNIYETIKGLEKKRLVNILEIEGSKSYEAVDPENLMDMITKKQDKLRAIIPQLKLSRKLAPQKSQVHVYEGLEAFKSLLNHFLDLGKPRLVMGGPPMALKLLKDFLKTYHEKRVELKVPMRQIYNFESMERARVLDSMPFTDVRCLPKEYDSPVSTTICGDEVAMSYWKGVPIFIHIIKKEVADSYRSYFELLWSKAKKPE